jgi:hypothetical protein
MRPRLPSPALVVASIALIVSLSGTAIAATPVVQRALFAVNAGKLQGKTAAQVAALPSPARTAAALATVRQGAAQSLAAGADGDFSAQCNAGEKAIAGGFSSDGAVIALDTRPTSAVAWTIYLANIGQAAASVTPVVTCLR